ncbi:hypothetical protein D3C80_1736170 [compost metagenome]
MRGVDDHRHDDRVRRLGIVTDQLLECLVGHDHVVRTAAVDEADHLAIQLHYQEALRVLFDPRGDLFPGGRFIAFVGRDLDLVAAVGVRRGGGAKGRNAHGASVPGRRVVSWRVETGW